MSNMVVRTNIFSLNAHRNMKNVGLEQRRASNRLSSGYRINSAADDAAGLAISETMRAQIRGLDQASRNAQDGQAMLLTTEGGLEEISNMLQRTRELLVQASNDTNTQDQRTMIEQEIFQLSQEIASMQNRVEFNTNRVLAMGPAMDSEVLDEVRLLQADNRAVTDAFNALNDNRALVAEAREALQALDGLMEVDAVADITRLNNLLTRVFDSIDFSYETGIFTVDVADTDIVERSLDLHTTLNALSENFTAGAVTGSLGFEESWDWATEAAEGTVTTLLAVLAARDDLLDQAIDELNVVRGNMSTDTLSIYENVQEWRSFIDNPTSGNNVAWFQVGANAGQGIQFDFETVSRAVTTAATLSQVASIMVSNPGGGSGIGSGIDVSPLIDMVQSSLDDISTVRANLGAVQNRMDYTMRSLDISSENLQDSESRVRNADMAREMMRFTMSNVLQQASISMLSQANQMPNNLLQVLR